MKKKRSPWPWVALLATVLLLGLGATYFYLSPSEELDLATIDEAGLGDDEEIFDADADTPESEDEGEDPGELEEVIEEGVADSEKMEAWLEDYADLMGSLGLILDEIDFEGMDRTRCQVLRRQIAEVKNNLGTAPDPEVDLLISRALGAFSEALQACRDNDEPAWSISLLGGKASTHEAQELMDRRYLYRGVIELELESETGAERSTESISGRFLASSLP